MPLSLAPHIHLAVLGQDVVLLDLRQGEYLCVPSGAALLRPAADRRGLAPAAADVAVELQEAGVAEPGPRRALELTPPRLPVRHALDRPQRRLTGAERLTLLLAIGDLLRAYWRRPLGDILAYAQTQAGTALSDDPERTQQLAAAFLRAVVWLPLSRKCLVRSFVLLRFLQRSGLRVRWVLGVRTWPFSAHCWIQQADVALDDAAERLVVYEPIVAVG